MDDNLSPQKYSWWERRTKIEKCLLVITGLCVVVIIYLGSNLLMTFPSRESPQRNVCMTAKCIQAAAHILEKMDKTVDPCDDFYKFACGNFIKTSVIPGDEVVISSNSKFYDDLNLQFMTLLEESIEDRDPHSLKLLKTIYKSCMNTTKIEKEGLTYVKQEFKNLGGMPVLEPYWNEKLFDWTSLLYRLKRNGWRRTFFFSMYIDIDMKNSSKHIFTISQPCMDFETFKKGFNETVVKATYDIMVEVATLFGADRETAIVDLKDVIDFKIDFAKIMISHAKRTNITLNYNPMAIREVQQKYPNIPWLKLINNYLSPVEMLTSDDIINVVEPEYFENLNNFLPKVKKRILANYMFITIIRSMIQYLPSNLQQKQLEYIKLIYGQQELSPRWEICVDHAKRLNIALSAIYVKKFFDKTGHKKQKVTELTIDIKNSFLDTLKKIGWMDRKTKKNALLKAENINSYVGYPDELLDDKIVEDYYQGLTLDVNGYFLNINYNISTFHHIKYVQYLRETVKKPDWKSQAYIYWVNAFYSQTDNAIELPAAILQDNFFDPERPQYMNYGAIGEVIGHEITHGFDDYGRQYDKDGNVIDWWEPETNRTFGRKTQCFVEQYGNYTVPEVEVSLNGVKTLSENIADNGGIKIAYKGYMRWLERNKAEKLLPGLPYTQKQLFWISSASNWCTKYKKQYLKESLKSGVHAPTYFRIMIAFMNSDHFGKDFNCPLGSPMNPRYKCRVW